MPQFTGAVIGCGRMGAFTSEIMGRYAPAFWLPLSHSEAMVAHPDISLNGLCDIDAELVARAQARYGVAQSFTDYRRLIDEVKPDVLSIATRTPERPAIIEYAINAGRRALHIEKPLCNSVAQLIHLERILAPPTVICTYGTLRRYARIYKVARDLAHSGRYGRLQQIQACFGAAPLFWTHPHSMDILLFLAGDPEIEWVSAHFDTINFTIDGSKIDGDPIITSAVIQFATGVTGLISQTGGCDVILACSNGTITVESDGRNIRCRHSDGENPYWDIVDVPSNESEKKGYNGGTCLALDRIVSGLRGNNLDQVAADKRAIFESQRLLFACAQSHIEGGAAVRLHEVDLELSISGRSGDRYA